MAFDLVIRGNCFLDGAFTPASVAIDVESGSILEVKKNLKGKTIHDFGNRLIFPGAIDPHVHFRDPGLTHKEDFYTGSLSAICGGVTTFFDMPNTIPPTIDNASLCEKLDIASRKSLADFGIYAAVTEDNPENLGQLAKSAVGFKIFLGSTTGNLLFPKERLFEAFEAVKKTGLTVVVHAEDNDCLKECRLEKEDSPLDHLASRPSKCEAAAVSAVLDAASRTGCRVHIAHVSSAEAIALLGDRPENVSCGATPHHLLLTAEADCGIPSFYKVNPPIRGDSDREALFTAFSSGCIDVLESDHAPHTIAEKGCDFGDAPSGMPGVETLLPLFMAQVKRGAISYERLAHATSEATARIFGIRNKGRIAKGYDADMAIFDVGNVAHVEASRLQSKCGWTPFEGHDAIFPTDVFRRGERILEDGEFTWDTGYGRRVENGLE
ncbi:MAG: dihydroorotase [Thermoplasmata archaeon HGW-Thermoplasmata-1]|nr:MAG: dihydroorotase [Thermoplasmata archaeon HGW-Thermoplasmata-1]